MSDNPILADEKPSELKATDTITVLEGFDAMHAFLEVVWRRHGKAAEDIPFLLAASRWADGSLVDPLIWEDWLMAVQTSRRPVGGRNPAGPIRDLLCP
jgi:hypothetical protein